jgi:predicted nucleic acid-binding protein
MPSSGCERRTAPGTGADRPVARIVLDTDVVSRYRSGRLPVGYARHLTANDLSITFITAGELWRGALTARWGGTRRGGLNLWLDEATIIAAGWAVARTWGAIATRAHLRGRPRPLHDTWIAACCIEGGLPLLTLNRRDFADFAEHDGLVLLGA